MSDCSTTTLTGLTNLPTLSFPIDVAGATLDQTFSKTSLVSGVDDTSCQTFCNLNQYTTGRRAQRCSEQGDPCTCSGDFIYLAQYYQNNYHGYTNEYDIIPTDGSGITTCSGFNFVNSNSNYDCFCQKLNSQLEVYADLDQYTSGGSTYTIHVDTSQIYSKQYRFSCSQGLLANSNWRYAQTNTFSIKTECGNIANINDLGAYDTLREVDDTDDCWMTIANNQILPLTEASSCSVLDLTAYYDMSDTSASPAVQLSGNAWYQSESFWTNNGNWFFDGTINKWQSNYRTYQDSYFYVLLTQTGVAAHGDATYWLGGSTPKQFNLFCQPCQGSLITAESDGEIDDIVIDLQAGVSNVYEISDYYSHSNDKFTPSDANNDGADCDAIYFYAFSDSALTSTWSDSDIVLSSAEAVDTQNNLIPDPSALTAQKLEVNTATSFRKQLFIKGLNSGRNFDYLETNVIVCGNEGVTQDAGDFIKLDFQKYRAYDYQVGGAYFASQITNDANYFRHWHELSHTPWMYLTDNTIIQTDSHWGCYQQVVYSLCVSISGNTCNEAWDQPEQLEKVQMVGNDLKINLTPFEPVDLYILVYYPSGQNYAQRKINVAVCGNETVHGSNETELAVQLGPEKVMAKLMYEYEAGSGSDGSNSTFVIDSSLLLETYDEQNYTDVHFYSTNPTYCPIYECDIVTYLDIQLGAVYDHQPNNRSSVLKVIEYDLPQGAGMPQKVGFQVHLKTTSSFYWETFWVRCFSQSTWDFYDQNAYLQVDLQVIDCAKESVEFVNQSEPFNFVVYQNVSTPVTFDVSSRFISSHPFFCPITEFRINKIIDLEKNSEVSGAWYRDIFIGDSNRTNDELAWTNLVITDTSKRAFFEVYVEAFTGNVSNDVTLPQVILTIEAAPNKAPYFLMEPDSEIFINLNSLGNSTVFRVKMPDIYDVNVWDLIRVEVFGSSVIQPLLSFDMETGILTLKGVTDQLKGDHEILIRISDEYDAETTYEIVLKVTRPAFEGFVIQEVSYEEEVAEIVEQEIVVEKSTKPVNAKITSIDQVGNMEITFSQTMDTASEDLKTIAESMQIDLSPYYIDDDFDEKLLEFDWEIHSYEGQIMKIKLTFINPLYVSMNLVQDQIIVSFNNQNLIRSQDKNVLGRSSTNIMSQIPKQMFDTDATRNFTKGAINLDIALNIIFWLMVIFNVLFSGTEAMEHYVLMINSLQIVMHVPLFSIALPGNVILFLEKTIPIVMFDIIKEDWRINPTNHFEFDEEHNALRTDDPRFTAQMADIGYDTHNFLNNVGSVYIFFSIYMVRVMMLGLLKLWTLLFDSGHDLYRKQFKVVFFKDLIVLFVEGYLEFCLAGYLQWSNLEVDKKEYYGERISSQVGNLSIFIACIFLPGCFIYMLTRPLWQVKDIAFEDRYGELYVGLRFKSKWSLSYYFVFILRRLTFLALAFKAYANPAQQIQALCLQNLMFSIYIGIVNPRLNRQMHWQELSNEMMIQLCSTILCLFVGDFVPSQDIKYLFGFILVFTISAIVIGNLILVFMKASRLIKMILVRYWHRLGRFLDPNYLKPIEIVTEQPEVITEPQPKPDQLLLDLTDLVGQEIRNDGLQFTFRQQDQIIQEQVLQEFCDNFHINSKTDQKQVYEEFEHEIHQLTELKKKEISQNIKMKKVKLQNLLKKDLSKWTTSDSVFWLEYELKLPKYSPNFLKVPLTGHMMVQMSEVSLRNDLKIRDKNDWVKIIQAIKQLKGDQQMLKGNGMNGMGSMGGELMIEENEFIEKEREGVYNSIKLSSKRVQSIQGVKEVLSEIGEENESDVDQNIDLERQENLDQFKNAQNNQALNVFRLQQEERMREVVKQQKLLKLHNNNRQKFKF